MVFLSYFQEKAQEQDHKKHKSFCILAHIIGGKRTAFAKKRKKPNIEEWEREREREKNGEATGTDGRVLQEEGRVEEAPDAYESAPPRHSWPRHRPCRLRHLPRRRAGLQQALCSFFFIPFSPPFSDFLCFSLSQTLSGDSWFFPSFLPLLFFAPNFAEVRFFFLAHCWFGSCVSVSILLYVSSWRFWVFQYLVFEN